MNLPSRDEWGKRTLCIVSLQQTLWPFRGLWVYGELEGTGLMRGASMVTLTIISQLLLPTPIGNATSNRLSFTLAAGHPQLTSIRS